MEPLNLLAFIKTTYGLAITLKSNIESFNNSPNEKKGLVALAETLEQNLYKIKVDYESTLNID